MKKLLLISTFVFLSFSVYSQISLDHTFINTNYYEGLQVVNTENTTFYCHIDEVDKRIKLYNSDYSIYKTINLQIGANYESSSLMGYLFSTHLFNTDNKIEFLISYKLSNSGNSNYNLVLYNEDGVILKNFGLYIVHHDSPPIIIKTKTNEMKLILTKLVVDSTTSPLTYSTNTEIYSLFGNSTVLNSASSNQKISAFPNPARTTVNLPYSLNGKENADITIYNSNGQLIEKKQVDSLFDKILLDVSGYSAGIYVYECNGESNRFIVK